MERNNLSFGPMDIDLSSQSVKEMEISFSEEVTRTPSVSPSIDPKIRSKSCSYKQPVVKKFHINIQKKPRSSKNTLLKIITAIITILIATITYHIYSLKCCDGLNLEKLNETLSTRLYGQNVAVNLIIKTLEKKANSTILFFSGGTGVGKTLTSSLILDTISTGSNVYHYVMPTFSYTFSTDLMFGLTMCKMSLIIVDDLTINDMDVKEQIKSLIDKSVNLGKEIIVILIFNCNENHKSFENRCDKFFKTRLEDNFSEIRALKRYIQFEPLSEIHLIECIKQELGDRKLNYRDFKDVLKNFNVSVDGCKGVHSKLKYLSSV